jgi:hypothetical protein
MVAGIRRAMNSAVIAFTVRFQLGVDKLPGRSQFSFIPNQEKITLRNGTVTGGQPVLNGFNFDREAIKADMMKNGTHFASKEDLITSE